MDQWRSLPEEQRNLLQAIRGPHRTIVEIVQDMRVKQWRVTKWFNRPRFKGMLKQVLREIRAITDAELARLNRAAVLRLAEMLEGKIPFDPEVASLCAIIIEVGETSRRSVPRRRKTTDKSHPVAKGPRLHPSHDQRNASKLIRSLYAEHVEAASATNASQTPPSQEGAEHEASN